MNQEQRALYTRMINGGVDPEKALGIVLGENKDAITKSMPLVRMIKGGQAVEQALGIMFDDEDDSPEPIDKLNKSIANLSEESINKLLKGGAPEGNEVPDEEPEDDEDDPEDDEDDEDPINKGGYMGTSDDSLERLLAMADKTIQQAARDNKALRQEVKALRKSMANMAGVVKGLTSLSKSMAVATREGLKAQQDLRKSLEASDTPARPRAYNVNDVQLPRNPLPSSGAQGPSADDVIKKCLVISQDAKVHGDRNRAADMADAVSQLQSGVPVPEVVSAFKIQM